MDCIDIDEDGLLLSEDESNSKYLIKTETELIGKEINNIDADIVTIKNNFKSLSLNNVNEKLKDINDNYSLLKLW